VTGVNWFGTLGDSVTIVTGFIFIVCVLALRKGIVGEILALFQRIETARQREKFPRRRSDHAHQ
jgi:branched-chain amino acid transport system permease protein